jgi:DNA-binding helix-hairpin-helix protein with protein kinase domain
VKIPAANLDPMVLPPGLLALARVAFDSGVENPAARPKASDWVLAIDEERARIKVCPNRPRHTFGSHLDACPWCRRVTLTGQDLFNDVPTMAQIPPMASIPKPKPGSSPVLLTFGITVLVLAAVILIMAKGG